jgi:hypothetical protein
VLKPEHRQILGDYDQFLFVTDFAYDSDLRIGTATYEVHSKLYSRTIDHFTSPQLQLCLNQGLYVLAYERGMLKGVFERAKREGRPVHEVCKGFNVKQNFTFHEPISPQKKITCIFTKVRSRENDTFLTADFSFNGGACTGDVIAKLHE